MKTKQKVTEVAPFTGFVGGTSRGSADGAPGKSVLFTNVGVVGLDAEITGLVNRLNAAIETGTAEAAAALAISDSDAAEVNRLQQLIRENESARERELNAARVAGQKAARAAVKGHDGRDYEKAAEEAESKVCAIDRRLPALKEALATAKTVRDQSRKNAQRDTARRLLNETEAAIHGLSDKLGRSLADILPELAKLRAARERYDTAARSF